MGTSRVKSLPLGSNMPNKVLIAGSLTIGAAGAITVVTPSGLGLGATIAADGQACAGNLFTVTHTTTGTYVIAPSETYIKIAYYNAGLRSAVAVGAADTRQVRTRVYNAAANTLTIEIVDTAAANALVNPASGESLQFFMEFITSSSPRT